MRHIAAHAAYPGRRRCGFKQIMFGDDAGGFGHAVNLRPES